LETGSTSTRHNSLGRWHGITAFSIVIHKNPARSHLVAAPVPGAVKDANASALGTLNPTVRVGIGPTGTDPCACSLKLLPEEIVMPFDRDTWMNQWLGGF